MRIVAISDVHLGRRSSRAEGGCALAPLFNGADLAVINGDGVDFGWMPPEEAVRLHEETLVAIREVCGKVVWIRGNHDLQVDGPILHREGEVAFTHGHALFDVPEGTESFEEAFEAVHDHHLRKHSTHRHGPLLQYADRLAQRIIPVGLASRLQIGRPEEVDLSLLLEAAGSGVRSVVIGHMHVTRIVPREEVMLYVTGGWTGRSPTSAFVYVDGYASLQRVIRSGAGFTLGEEIPAPGPVIAPVPTT